MYKRQLVGFVGHVIEDRAVACQRCIDSDIRNLRREVIQQVLFGFACEVHQAAVEELGLDVEVRGELVAVQKDVCLLYTSENPGLVLPQVHCRLDYLP